LIDIKEILKHQRKIEKALRKRLDNIDLSNIVAWKKERDQIQTSLDQNRRKKKQYSQALGPLMRDISNNQEEINAIRAKDDAVSALIEDDESALKELNQRITDVLVTLPNIPEDEVPPGGKEANEVLYSVGKKPEFSFEPLDHVDISASLGLVDFERGAKIGGRGKWVYWREGALLEWALINYFISIHRKNGYDFVLPPHILNREAGYVAGQFPKFIEDVFFVTDDKSMEKDFFMLPTAETALVNLFANEIIPGDQLPIRLFSYTPCYRNESFGYHSDERGTIRGNQFNKVEVVIYCKPEESQKYFNEILAVSEEIMQGLGLHYRVSRLAARDCSHSMAKTYDVEVWIPSIQDYKEVSSVSTAHTYQAIRGNIRYKNERKKNVFVHTLNGSALATSRTFPAILEQFQQADGKIHIPEVLQPMMKSEYLGG
jgi:seryl-tRNA synthetase